MELTKQVVSLELAKKLKELGVRQESLHWWQVKFPTNKARLVQNPSTGGDDDDYEWYSAFTVAELGEMLNNVGAEKFIKAYGEVFNFKGTQMVGLLGVINLMRLPDMGAKMLIYLLENKLI